MQVHTSSPGTRTRASHHPHASSPKHWHTSIHPCSAIREWCIAFNDVRAVVVEVVGRWDELRCMGALPAYERQALALEALQVGLMWCRVCMDWWDGRSCAWGSGTAHAWMRRGTSPWS